MRNKENTNANPKKHSAAKAQVAMAFDGIAERPRVLQLLIAVLLSCALFYVCYAYPLDWAASDRDAARAEAEALKKKNDEAETIRADEDSFIEEFAKLYRISLDTQTLLPPSKDISKMFESVEQRAKSLGLRSTRFSSAQPGAPIPFTSATPNTKQDGSPAAADQGGAAAAQPQQPSNKLFEVTVRAQVTGDHKAVAKFLASLAGDERIILVKTLAINGSDGREETLDLELATYYAPPPESLAAIPDRVKEIASKL
jgi:Tfp pilus assembly protein PilO